MHVHDVFGDTKSDNIWFDINRSPLIGKLDPNTGKVTSWRIPGTEGKHPGAHWIQAEKDGTVWYSETWSQSLIRFNPLTEIFKKMSSGVQGNMALAPDGTIWRTAVARWLALIVKPQKSSRHSRLEISGFQTLMATSSAGMDDILEEGIATGLLMVLFSSTEKPKKSG